MHRYYRPCLPMSIARGRYALLQIVVLQLKQPSRLRMQQQALILLMITARSILRSDCLLICVSSKYIALRACAILFARL